MASSQEFKNFILDQLNVLQDVTCRPMMGEFLLYYKGVLFGGIYDDRLLIKKTNFNKKYLLNEEIPYPNAKPMYIVVNLEDVNYLKELVEVTYKDLKK